MRKLKSLHLEMHNSFSTSLLHLIKDSAVHFIQILPEQSKKIWHIFPKEQKQKLLPSVKKQKLQLLSKLVELLYFEQT